MKGMENYGGMAMATMRQCCEKCGRLLEQPEDHGIKFTANGIRYQDGPLIHMTLRQRQFLHALVRGFGDIVHRESLLTSVYGDDSCEVSDKMIDVMICHIRKKLADTPLRIETIYGMGFRLHVPNVEN